MVPSSLADSVPRSSGLPPLYAVVVVNTPLARRAKASDDLAPDGDGEPDLAQAFHYSVPDRLRDGIRVGQLVWVPFGARYLQGVVIALESSSPVETTRDVDQIADPEPVLSPVLIELAHWMSAYYLAPIQQVIVSVLPPGLVQSAEITVSATPGSDLSGATEPQQELYSTLLVHGPVLAGQVVRLYGHSNWRTVLEQLVDRGWASKTHDVQPPRVKPKYVPVVRAHPEVRAIPDLRSEKQRVALEYLVARRDSADGWLLLSQVSEETGVSPSAIRALEDKGLAELAQRHVWRDPLRGQAFVPVAPPRLTPDQIQVWETIHADLEAPGGRPFLLQGVTGSGKTEIYLRAVQKVLERGKGAIVLVPEIALTPQTIRRFGARFATTLAVVHSHLSPGERYDQWRRMRAGELRLAVGSRSALFSPLAQLGLVVVDEEHEGSYKQERTPRYHAREVAVRLSRLAGATCILGSATPSLESSYRADQGHYVRLLMPQRIMGHTGVVNDLAGRWSLAHGRYRPVEGERTESLYTELPPVQVVDMRAELRAGNRSIFSRPLENAIHVALAGHEQIILFLNRRGSATFVQCRDCGHVLECPRCNLPLTYHSAVDDLICHHCGYKTFLPPQCPSCWSGRIKFFGIGTEKVEQLVHEAWPLARVVRWDLDTTGGKLSHEQLLDQFVSGQADIMVGTQMIAKGLDLPKVTLVGVITADTMINLPDFRSSERTFQLLTQVAGRAGRSILGGKVVIQTYTPEHPAIQAASKHDYPGFYARELAFRREHWYPPFSQLIRLVYGHAVAETAQREAERLHGVLVHRIARLGLASVDVIGPAPSYFARLRGKWLWQILIRGRRPSELLKEAHMPLGWRVDVDPVSLL